ncbi:MAG: 1,4-alpha-glucan branching protein GlgB [Myxococcales bacterium]|jgi:1,4-alpha-glucan branching enzyme|nr:1,4-alpha-glucan branching protein GlgB [Myxococcales bacterium]
MPLNQDAMRAIINATHGQPFDVLGAKVEKIKGKNSIVVRSFHPEATALAVIDAKGKLLAEAKKIDPAGFFEADLGISDLKQRYRLRLFNEGGTWEIDDPYAFSSLLTEYDLHLLREGTHQKLWDKLGSHLTTRDGVDGVEFAVWAPSARRVSVVGDFNSWDGRRHPMRKHEGNGLWELFIPGLELGQNYKYEILPPVGDVCLLKVDPVAFQVEVPPKTAARIARIDDYEWKDAAWLDARKQWNYLEAPISIYEMHFGSWRHKLEDGNRSLSYTEMAAELAAYVKDMGYTHIELMPMTEHPFYGSWGYQTVNFFAPTGRYGTPDELRAFIDAMHQNGIGVILDWVPAHFPSDAYGLAEFDGTHLYEHADPRQGKHPEWGTLVFNYGRTEVWNYLIANALFWLDQYHFDGLRVDAVASMLYLDYSRKDGEWIPNRYGGKENLESVEFVKHLNCVVGEKYPGALTIAEESTSWSGVSRPVYLGGLGFSMKWNMGWMHDILEFFSKDPIYRKYHSNMLTFSMLYAYSENFVLALSHDEVVHGKRSLLDKMPGDAWQKRANLRSLLGFMYGHPGKKLNFMGTEIGQWNEWNHDSSLDWHLLDYEDHKGIQRWVRDLNRVYRDEPSLYEQDFKPEGFQWIDCSDVDRSVYSFVRYAKDRRDFTIFVCNLTPTPHENYRIGVPEAGLYTELLNSDAGIYGGSNMGNGGAVQADPQPWQAFQNSMAITLPPLSVTVLKPQR